MVSLVSPVHPYCISRTCVHLSLLASYVFCQCCIMPLFSSGRQVLLYSCCITLLLDLCVNVCGERICFACVCQSVLQSSVAMAMPGTWLRQLCSPALEESCCRRPLCLCSGEMHTHTNNFLNVNQTDWRTDWISHKPSEFYWLPVAEIALLCIAIPPLKADRLTDAFVLQTRPQWS